MFGKVRMQLGADDADFLIGMDHGFAVARALAENGSRKQRSERCGGGGLDQSTASKGHKRTSLSRNVAGFRFNGDGFTPQHAAVPPADEVDTDGENRGEDRQERENVLHRKLVARTQPPTIGPPIEPILAIEVAQLAPLQKRTITFGSAQPFSSK